MTNAEHLIAPTTEADRILAQLRTWSQHDPEFCRLERTNFSGGHDIDVRVGDTWFTIWATTLGAISSSGLAMLLSALMSAIAVKGLRLALDYYPDDKSYTAVLFLAADDIRTLDRGWDGDRTEAAIVLLTAYLAAIETETTTVAGGVQ
ncbi:MAG: hypothetical protein KME45_03010 [Stenomitos rutilans HA7619-LM2]|nr:hypothetical protein [Stenomitos rutilans HA7619-LM2]MBW4469354.1 hypothetical protein [Stenomitos rutilans HA7619-LM2]